MEWGPLRQAARAGVASTSWTVTPGFPEELNLLRVRAVVRDEDPGGGNPGPGMERPLAELGGIRQDVDGVAAPRHQFLEPRLRLVGLAQAVVRRHRVRAQEHPVETHPLQGRLGEGTHEGLAHARGAVRPGSPPGCPANRRVPGAC